MTKTVVKTELNQDYIDAIDAWRRRLVAETGEIISRPAAIRRMIKAQAAAEFAAVLAAAPSQVLASERS